MLKVFRDNLKRLVWVLWVVIAAFILLVFVDFGGAGFQRAQGDRTAATVGDETITREDFRRQYQQNERRAQELYGANYTPELGRQLGLAVQSLDGLVAERILAAEARRVGLDVDENELREAILEIPGFSEPNGSFVGQEQYQQILRANGFTIADFERDLRSQLLIQKLRSVLAGTVHVTAAEIEDAYRDEVERASIRYFEVDAERFRDRVETTPADLEAYFDAHHADFRIPERRTVDFLLVEPRLLRATIQIDDAELRAYYDANQAEFTNEEQVRARHILLTASGPDAVAAARAKAEDFKRQVAAGADFGALARQFSQDETTRDRGGDLGFFGRGRYSPAIEDAAFAAQVGEVVGPVESDLLNQTGIELIEVLERREGGVADFESVRPRIQSRLLNERSVQAAETLANEIRASIDEDEVSSADGIRALAEGREGVSFESVGPFRREDNVPGFGRGTTFTVTAFELERDAVSQPIQAARGWVILRLAGIEEARLPELHEVEEQVRDAVVEEKAKQAAIDALRQSAEAIRAGTAIEQAAEALGATVQSSGEFSRSGPVGELGREPALAEAVFALEAGAVGGPVTTQRGAAVFLVDEHTLADPIELASRRDEIRRRIAAERLDNLLFSIIEKRRNELEVHYNQQLLEAFGALPTASG